MDAQTRVRLKGNPTQIGITTDASELRGDRQWRKVMFPDRDKWIPLDQLELVEADQTPIDLFRSGKFGTASDFRRTITHARITGRLADFIYSLEATNTDFYPYQFKPVLKLLQSPSNSLLIADEVGLGKTIEAGLIWTELRARFDARRLVVVCPSVLQEKWRFELSSKMGVRAEIVNAKRMHEILRDEDARKEGFALIGSVQGLRPRKEWDDAEKSASEASKLARFLQENESEEPLVDLLIIDEAHYLRTAGNRSHELGQLMGGITDYSVFLSATPIHNKNEDLFSLLTLLDPDTFQQKADFANILEANGPLVRARDIVLQPNSTATDIVEQLDAAQAYPALRTNRQIASIRQSIEQGGIEKKSGRSQLAYQLETVNLLGHVVTRTRKREVQELRVIRDPVAEGIELHPLEKIFYDRATEAVCKYAERGDINQRFLLAQPQRQMTSCMPAALQTWQNRGKIIEGFDTDPNSDWTQEALDQFMGPLSQALAISSIDMGSVAKLRAVDTKFERLRQRLDQYLNDFPEEKVVLFSTFKATLNYLAERLTDAGISSVLLTGDATEPKDEIIKKFADPAGPSVLLSSEVGGEGIDLQFSRLVINYDLPWNPMRVEQRIGRLDRIGQNADRITIWNLFHEGTIDGRIYRRLYEKLDLCREALGDFEAVLGEEIRDLTRELLDPTLSVAQQEERIDQTALALENQKQVQNELEDQAGQLVAYGDYILNQVKAAHDLYHWITAEDLKSYISDFLMSVDAYRSSEIRRIKSTGTEFEIRLSGNAKADLSEFIRQERIMTSTTLTRSQSAAVICRFDTKANSSRGDRSEIINQFHPLIRFASNRIDASDWQLRPAIASKVHRDHANGLDPGVYAIGVAYWSVEGLRPIEKLFYLGVKTDQPDEILASEIAEKLALAAAMEGEDWLSIKSDIDIEATSQIVTNALMPQMQDEFEKFENTIKASNEDRADIQLSAHDRHLARSLASLTETKQRHIDNGRRPLVQATEGRIKALKDRVSQEKRKIEERRQIQSQTDDTCLALIQVT